MFKFGKTSISRLDTCHPDLIKIMEHAISFSKVDFSITEGHRSIERQQQLYSIGRTTRKDLSPVTNVDGVNRKSNHNYSPSMAVDIAIYHPEYNIRKQIIYDFKHLSYVAGVIQATAIILYKKDEVKHLVKWGYNWDNDGVLGIDQSFIDAPHFELYLPSVPFP